MDRSKKLVYHLGRTSHHLGKKLIKNPGYIATRKEVVIMEQDLCHDGQFGDQATLGPDGNYPISAK